MISVECCHGNILDVLADILVLSGNPSLHLTGGVGADLVTRYPGNMQRRLHSMVADRLQHIADRGDIFVDQSEDFPYTAIIHAVAVNAFYESDEDVIREIVVKALNVCREFNVERVAMSCLATGFGNLSLDDFCQGFNAALKQPNLEFSGTVVLAQIEPYRYEELLECLNP